MPTLSLFLSSALNPLLYFRFSLVNASFGWALGLLLLMHKHMYIQIQ
jgi:hypothetical protein